MREVHSSQYRLSARAKADTENRNTVLIVDENIAERTILSGCLQKDYTIVTAVGGAEAIAMLETEQERIAAIVLDIALPKMEGDAIMHHLRGSAVFSHIPIIVSTNPTDDETLEQAIACGADAFVPKPCSRALLLHTIKNAVHLRDMITTAEQASSEQQQQKKLLDHLPVGAALYAFDGETIRAIHMNKRYWQLVGRAPGDDTDTSIFDTIHPDDHEMIGQEIRSAIRQKRNAEMDLRILTGSGSYKPFHVSANIIAEHGDRYALFASFQPITEDAMSMQQMLPIALSTMMSSSNDFSYVMDKDFRYICCSKSAARLFGLESERDIFEKTNTDLLGATLGDSFTASNRAVAETGKPLINHLVELPHADRGLLFVSTSIYPISDPGGSIIGLYGISRDVSEEHQLNFELDTLLNTIPSGVLKYAADESEQFAYVNRNFVESLGYTQASFREKFHNCFREMVWHEDRERAEAEILRQEANGGIGKFDYRVEAADGALRWIHDEGIKITDRNGKSWYYVTLVDITDSHDAYEQLKLFTDSTPTGLATYVCTPDSIRISYCNSIFCTIIGSTPDRLALIMAADPTSYIFEDDRQTLLDQFAALTRDNETLDCVYRIRNKKGDLKWIHQRAIVSEQRGESLLINSAVFDITVQEEAREKLRVSEEVNRLALEHSGKIVAQFDVKAQSLTMPESVKPIFELPRVLSNMPEEQIALGRISPETADVYRKAFEDVLNGSPSGEVTFQQHSSLGWRWIELHYTTVFSSMNEPLSAVVTFADVTEQLEKEMVYHKWQQSLSNRPMESYTLFRCNLSKNAFFDSCEGTLIDIRFVHDQQDFGELTAGYLQRVFEEDKERYLAFVNSDAMLAGYYRGRRADMLEYREVKPDGSVRWLKLSVELVEYPNSKDVEVYLMYEDINEAKLIELQTKQKAETDPLTGVLNRVTFAANMDEILRASRSTDIHALMLVDVDNFKHVNDSFGHEAGDRVLCSLTKRMREMLRKDDLIGRLGGDEFFVFLKSIPGAELAAGKARQICNLNIPISDSDSTVSVSVGIAMSPSNGDCFDALYRKADAAMYTQKTSGKNGYRVFGREEL